MLNPMTANSNVHISLVRSRFLVYIFGCSSYSAYILEHWNFDSRYNTVERSPDAHISVGRDIPEEKGSLALIVMNMQLIVYSLMVCYLMLYVMLCYLFDVYM